MKQQVNIYRSARHEGMYLFVSSGDDLSRVPGDLQQQFGRAEMAMTLLLTPGRRLARADTAEVIEAIEAQGYYLQLPPGETHDRLLMAGQNQSLDR